MSTSAEGPLARSILKTARARLFADADRPDGPPVVIIDEVIAKCNFKNTNSIGQRLSFDRVPDARMTCYTIIGVAANEHTQLDADPQPDANTSLLQAPRNRVILLLRTSGDPMGVAASTLALIRELDMETAFVINWPVQARVEKSTARIHFLTTLMLIFANVGMLLWVVGVYGALA